MAGPGVDLVQCVVDRTALATAEDDAVFTMHCRGMQASLPDDLFPIDDAGRVDFATKLMAYWNAIKTNITSGYLLREINFYALPAAAGEPMGPPVKQVLPSLPGTGGTGEQAFQVACSVTFITDQRKTWGRFYLPGFIPSVLVGGVWTNSVCDSIAAATHGLTSRSGNGACLTVWSRKQWTHHDPQRVQVDNIPDVIRRRRKSQPTYRANIAAG
jgi:hypothetical protein